MRESKVEWYSFEEKKPDGSVFLIYIVGTGGTLTITTDFDYIVSKDIIVDRNYDQVTLDFSKTFWCYTPCPFLDEEEESMFEQKGW